MARDVTWPRTADYRPTGTSKERSVMQVLIRSLVYGTTGVLALLGVGWLMGAFVGAFVGGFRWMGGF